MNRSILLALCLLASSFSFAQTKGFLILNSAPLLKDFSFTYTARRCLEWKSQTRNVENCSKFESAALLTSGRHEPLTPGFYTLLGLPTGDDTMVEVKLGKPTNLNVRLFNPADLAKQIPLLEYYMNQDRFYFTIQTDFKVASYQLKAEKMTRALINGKLNTNQEHNSIYCKVKKTALEHINAGSVRICYNGISRVVPIKVFPEAQKILNLLKVDISPSTYINKYNSNGTSEIPEFHAMIPLTKDDYQSDKPEDIASIAVYSERSYYASLHFRFSRSENKQSYAVSDHFVLFPGSYILVIQDNSNIVDTLEFKIP